MVSKKEVTDFLHNLNFIFQYGNDYILIDKNSPRIYKITKKVFLHLKDNLEIFPALIEDYYNLKRWSYLPDKRKYRFYSNNPPKLSLRVSEDCNLNCRYCFSKNNMLNYKGRGYMAKDTAIKALNFFLSYFKKDEAQIIFYGGEPLMNFNTIKQTTDYIRKIIDKHIKLKIVTNGTIINKDILKWLIDNNVEVAVTLDFPPLEHNRNRPFKDGCPSFGIIKNNFIKLTRNCLPRNLFIKTVIADDTNFSLSDIWRSFYKSGIKIPTNNFTSACEFQKAPGASLSLRALQLKIVKQRDQILDKQRKNFTDTNDTSKLNWVLDIDEKLEIIMTGRQPFFECDAGNNGISVNPLGDIYFCDIVANVDEFHIGNIKTGIDELKLKTLKEKYCFRPKECFYCWAMSLCNISCPLSRPNEESRRITCRIYKQNLISALKFFLSLDHIHRKSMIQYAISKIEEGKYAQEQRLNFKVALEIYKFLNVNNKYLKPVNLLPY